MKTKKFFFIPVVFLAFTNLYAQTTFPAGDFWALDVGAGMSDILVKDGLSFLGILDARFWLSPPLMIGSKLGVNYSLQDDAGDILVFEGQAYLRWNFLRLGHHRNPVNIFTQLGLGLLSAYRGNQDNPDNLFQDVTMTRGSLMGEGALGITIPLSQRWHIEPSIRGGYPHIAGFGLTIGYKFPLPKKAKYFDESDIFEIVRILPPEEIIKEIMISLNEFILFGPDIGKYNIGVDRDAQGLNELVLNSTVEMLKENSDLRVRIEGHANPVTADPSEADELMTLSALRANAVAAQLKARGISDDQMIIISYGGTRTVTHDHEIWNRNRRVELIVMQIEPNKE